MIIHQIRFPLSFSQKMAKISEIMKNMKINFYQARDKDTGFLSNFYHHTFTYKGKEWMTSEHAFQAQKFAGTPHEEEIRLAKGARQAADMGRDRSRPLRADWESVKDSIMEEIVRAKFASSEELTNKLLLTSPFILVEHTVNDSYWGDGGDGSGKNMLGKILMKIREEIKE